MIISFNIYEEKSIIPLPEKSSNTQGVLVFWYSTAHLVVWSLILHDNQSKGWHATLKSSQLWFTPSRIGQSSPAIAKNAVIKAHWSCVCLPPDPPQNSSHINHSESKEDRKTRQIINKRVKNPFDLVVNYLNGAYQQNQEVSKRYKHKIVLEYLLAAKNNQRILWLAAKSCIYSEYYPINVVNHSNH